MSQEPDLEQITQKIVQRFHPHRIILFGSRARGNARPDSDVDLLIEMESDLAPAARTIEVDSVFGLRSWAMDVLVYTPAEIRRLRAVPWTIVARAEAEGKVLYEQPAA